MIDGYFLFPVLVSDSRDADEGCVSSVEEGAVEDLQDEGEVLQREEGDGGAHGKQEALQRRQEQRQAGGAQVRLLLGFSCSGTEGRGTVSHAAAAEHQNNTDVTSD